MAPREPGKIYVQSIQARIYTKRHVQVQETSNYAGILSISRSNTNSLCNWEYSSSLFTKIQSGGGGGRAVAFGGNRYEASAYFSHLLTRRLTVFCWELHEERHIIGITDPQRPRGCIYKVCRHSCILKQLEQLKISSL